MTDPTVAHPRIPSLDGIRAISITLVLLAHARWTSGFWPDGFVLGLVDWGFLGVEIFFVISGYLITRLLLDEHGASGAIDVAAFYIRRAFRIIPAYAVYVATIAILSGIGYGAVNRGDFLAAVTYTMNYRPTRGWLLGHAWTLSVEEQFYLLWPASLLFLGVRRSTWAALAAVAVAPLIRLAYLVHPPSTLATFGPMQLNSFEVIGDSIAAGCLLGIAGEHPRVMRYITRVVSFRAFVFVPLIGIAAATLSGYPGRIANIRHLASLIDRSGVPLHVWLQGAYVLVGVTVVNVTIALCIQWCISHPHGVLGRALNSRPLVHFGLISYSLYLWQQLFLDRFTRNALTSYPLNLVLAIAVASASYYGVERVALRMRNRLLRGRRRPPRDASAIAR